MSSVERRKHIDMPEYTRTAANLTIEEAAIVVEGQAVQLAPVDFGTLEDSIYRKVLSPVEAEVGATAGHAVYQEFGTSKHRAQPFLRPALDSLRSKLGKVWSEASRQARNKARRTR